MSMSDYICSRNNKIKIIQRSYKDIRSPVDNINQKEQNHNLPNQTDSIAIDSMSSSFFDASNDEMSRFNDGYKSEILSRTSPYFQPKKANEKIINTESKIFTVSNSIIKNKNNNPFYQNIEFKNYENDFFQTDEMIDKNVPQDINDHSKILFEVIYKIEGLGTYIGQVNKYGQLTGFGTILDSSDKVLYEGEFLENNFNGVGIMYNNKINKESESIEISKINEMIKKNNFDFLRNVLRYEGFFVNGLFHGLGTIYNKSEEHCSIIFVNGLPTN